MRYLAKRVERICDELYRLRIVHGMDGTRPRACNSQDGAQGQPFGHLPENSLLRRVTAHRV